MYLNLNQVLAQDDLQYYSLHPAMIIYELCVIPLFLYIHNFTCTFRIQCCYFTAIFRLDDLLPWI